MEYKQTTQVPNVLFDAYLPTLTESELKILLVVIRQTYGWMDKNTGKRKERDRISGSQFRKKTGLSKRIVTKAVKSLVDRHLMEVSDFKGNPLMYASDRKGKKHLYFRPIAPELSAPQTSAQSAPVPVHKGDHNKTNYTKPIRTGRKEFSGHIGEIVSGREFFNSLAP